MAQTKSTVAITGATAGVGRAAAIEFAKCGYNVGLIARGKEGLEETRQQLEALGAKCVGVETDVANPQQVEAAAAQIEAELGAIEVWVNSAMATVFSPVDKMTAEEYKHVNDTTYLGYVHGTLSALKRMKPRDSGCIVQVGSAMAYRSIPLQSAYCAAKAAIRGFTDALRSELIHDNSRVRVSMVQLPAQNTPQFDWARNKLGKRPQPLPPIYTPEVAGRAIVRAAQESPRELWIGRSTVMAIIGTGLLPGFLDRKLAKQAYDRQMGNENADPLRQDNLEHPVEGLHQAHGRFEQKAQGKAFSVRQETFSTLSVAAAVAGLWAAASALGNNRRR